MDPRIVHSKKWSVRKPNENLSSSLSSMCHWQRAPSKTIFLKWINFQTKNWKKVHCLFYKISLQQTTCSSQACSLSSSVQLDFSWSLRMSDRKINKINPKFQSACWSESRRLSPTVQLNLNGLTKYQINEMSGFQSYLAVETVPWVPCDLSKSSFQN